MRTLTLVAAALVAACSTDLAGERRGEYDATGAGPYYEEILGRAQAPSPLAEPAEPKAWQARREELLSRARAWEGRAAGGEEFAGFSALDDEGDRRRLAELEDEAVRERVLAEGVAIPEVFRIAAVARPLPQRDRSPTK